MKKFIIALIVSMSLAMLSAEMNTRARQPAPIVYKITELPRYGRRKPLRNHFEPGYDLV
jgi:hypothetical protein